MRVSICDDAELYLSPVLLQPSKEKGIPSPFCSGKQFTAKGLPFPYDLGKTHGPELRLDTDAPNSHFWPRRCLAELLVPTDPLGHDASRPDSGFISPLPPAPGLGLALAGACTQPLGRTGWPQERSLIPYSAALPSPPTSPRLVLSRIVYSSP